MFSLDGAIVYLFLWWGWGVVAMIQMFERQIIFFFSHVVPAGRTRVDMWDSRVNRFLFYIRKTILLIRVVQ